MGCYVGANGYYEGDQIGLDLEVPQRPSPLYAWSGTEWALGPTPVPESVTMRQARLALLQNGMLSNVDAAINAMASPQKEAAQIEWQYSSMVERHKALVLSLGPALGLTDAQMDQLFITAAEL